MQEYLMARENLLNFFSRYIYNNNWEILKIIYDETILMRYLIKRFNIYFPDDTYEFMTIYPYDAKELGENLKEDIEKSEIESIKKSIKIIERYLS